MKYGINDTADLSKWAHGYNDISVGTAQAMPSVGTGGHRSKTNKLRSTGYGPLYIAGGFDWAFNGLKPRVDAEWFKIANQPVPSNKQNHQSYLAEAGLITVQGKPKHGQYLFLTDAGVEQVKAVSPELGKLAKAHLTQAAYDKAVKAAAKAAKAPARATDAVNEPEATQVPEATDNSTSEAPTVTAEVVAMLDEVAELDKVLDDAEAEAIKLGYEGADITAYVEGTADDWRKANH